MVCVKAARSKENSLLSHALRCSDHGGARLNRKLCKSLEVVCEDEVEMVCVKTAGINENSVLWHARRMEKFSLVLMLVVTFSSGTLRRELASSVPVVTEKAEFPPSVSVQSLPSWFREV